MNPNVSYIRQSKVGEGTYAVVYKALMFESPPNTPKLLTENISNTPTTQVALKKIKLSDNSKGFELNGLRELASLKRLTKFYKSSNILTLIDSFILEKNIFLVFDFLAFDLEKILRSPKIILTPGETKHLYKNIIKGVEQTHRLYILHRDLKPSNILLDEQSNVKVADFGLARSLEDKNMSVNIVTRWYRSPELLLGESSYTTKIDIWALGLILAEIYLKRPLMTGESDIKQLELIFSYLGAPTKESWPEYELYSNNIRFKGDNRDKLRETLKDMPQDMFEVIKSTLRLNPNERKEASELLELDYFKNDVEETKFSIDL